MPKMPNTYEEAIRLADVARRKAAARKEAIRQRLMLEPWRFRGITTLGTVVDRWCSVDPIWKTAVADNQWYLAQAAAFAGGEVGHALRFIIMQQTQILALLQEIRDDDRAAAPQHPPRPRPAGPAVAPSGGRGPV